MAKYLLIESRDSFQHADVGYFCAMAKDLASSGNEVTLFLTQNAVLMARQGVQANAVESTIGSSVNVLADDFCLRERAIRGPALLPGIRASGIDHLVDLLTQDSVKAVWH